MLLAQVLAPVHSAETLSGIVHMAKKISRTKQLEPSSDCEVDPIHLSGRAVLRCLRATLTYVSCVEDGIQGHALHEATKLWLPKIVTWNLWLSSLLLSHWDQPILQKRKSFNLACRLPGFAWRWKSEQRKRCECSKSEYIYFEFSAGGG